MNGVRISYDPLKSKIVRFYNTNPTNASPVPILTEITDELTNGVTVNTVDLPCYMVALEILKQYLSTRATENQKKAYEILLNDTQLITVDFQKPEEE